MTGHLARSKLDSSSYFKVPAPFLDHAVGSCFLFDGISSSQPRVQMTNVSWVYWMGNRLVLPVLPPPLGFFDDDSSARNPPSNSVIPPRSFIWICIVHDILSIKKTTACNFLRGRKNIFIANPVLVISTWPEGSLFPFLWYILYCQFHQPYSKY